MLAGESSEGPILADFLAMGAGRVLPQGTPLVQVPRPAAAAVVRPAVSRHTAQEKDLQEPAVRERRLVAAALQPADVLATVPSSSPPRGPVSPAALREPKSRVPPLFSQGYVAYQDRIQPEHTEMVAQGWPRVPGDRFFFFMVFVCFPLFSFGCPWFSTLAILVSQGLPCFRTPGDLMVRPYTLLDK